MEHLIAEAHEQHLQDDRYWDILLHYQPKGHGRLSLVDDPKFFLAPVGKHDPSAELDATLRGLFDSPESGNEHPRCRFPARAAWLIGKLSINEASLPAVVCAQFNEVMNNVKPRSAVLIFPAAHGNGPASMFGHTLLRIDGNSTSDLLSYAVNYAAAPDDDNGLLYAFKGIFGYYPGYFSLRPYYEKVAEYNDIEYRDIWEFKLNLTEQETRNMVLHIWEMKDIYSDYYFFDENCSYDLLFLLEAARPTVHLTDKFGSGIHFWVIPSDTIREIRASGLITSVKYRPSRATRILALTAGMEPTLQERAVEIGTGLASPQSVNDAGLSDRDKAKVLDLSAEYLQYLYAGRKLNKEIFQKRYLASLTARSSLGLQTQDGANIQIPPQPEEGHLPGRLTIGYCRRQDQGFAEIAWRAAYHDLLDPHEGYVEGSSINFFDVHFRADVPGDTLQLQSFRLLDIVSLADRNRFFQPVSWKVNTGIERELMPDGAEKLLYRVNPGGGLAHRTSMLGLSYVFLEADAMVSTRLPKTYAVGIGASVGTTRMIGDRWKLLLDVRALSYELGQKHQSVKASLAQNFKFNRDNSLSIRISRERSFDHYATEGIVAWNLFL